MDEWAAGLADRLTAGFYEACAASFAQTRRSGWPGWARLEGALGELAGRAAREGRPLWVLDVGCGTFRFERWLQGALPGVAVEAVGLDQCLGLAAGAPAGCRLVETEVGRGWALPREFCGRFDVAVAFGLLHHLPREQGRRAVAAAVASALVSGGVGCVSAWRLLDDDRLRDRAVAATAAALGEHPGLAGRLGPCDVFLGWQGRTDVLRFCHHVGEAELDGLSRAARDAAPGVVEEARFFADGRSGRLNRYLVLRRVTDQPGTLSRPPAIAIAGAFSAENRPRSTDNRDCRCFSGR